MHGPAGDVQQGISTQPPDVVQNLYLGREARDWLHRLDETTMERRTAEALARLAVTTIGSIRQPSQPFQAASAKPWPSPAQ